MSVQLSCYQKSRRPNANLARALQLLPKLRSLFKSAGYLSLLLFSLMSLSLCVFELFYSSVLWSCSLPAALFPWNGLRVSATGEVAPVYLPLLSHSPRSTSSTPSLCVSFLPLFSGSFRIGTGLPVCRLITKALMFHLTAACCGSCLCVSVCVCRGFVTHTHTQSPTHTTLAFNGPAVPVRLALGLSFDGRFITAVSNSRDGKIRAESAEDEDLMETLTA